MIKKKNHKGPNYQNFCRKSLYSFTDMNRSKFIIRLEYLHCRVIITGFPLFNAVRRRYNWGENHHKPFMEQLVKGTYPDYAFRLATSVEGLIQVAHLHEYLSRIEISKLCEFYNWSKIQY